MKKIRMRGQDNGNNTDCENMCVMVYMYDIYIIYFNTYKIIE